MRGAKKNPLAQSSPSPAPLSFASTVTIENPITFVLVTQILINAVYERDPNRPALSPRRRRGQAAVRRSAERMAGAQYISSSSSSSSAAAARAKNGLTLQLRLRTSFCSTSLISQMSLAEARPLSCVCRLIYDLCSRRGGGGGGALGRSATSTPAPHCNNWPAIRSGKEEGGWVGG